MLTNKLKNEDELPLTCSRKGTCCHGNNVNLNPWEIVCLAKEKGINPRKFRDLYCEFGGIRLHFDGKAGWNNQPACGQYVDGFGCDVHLGRPLACRLYPLGRQKQGSETIYMHQGNKFPCLEGCPEVVNLPKMTVGTYIEGQATQSFEQAQDLYLEIMQNLADMAFVLLLETGLVDSHNCKTLSVWREMGNEAAELLETRIGTDWIDLLMLPELPEQQHNLLEFANHHNELLQINAQESFGSLTSMDEVEEASVLMMALALHLGRGLGAKPTDLVNEWITVAIENGAKE